MSSLAGVVAAIQTSVTVSEAEARSAGFCRRKSKLDASTFCRGLVLGWWQDPSSTLEMLAGSVSIQGVPISPQGLDQRFNERSAKMLRQVLERTTTQLIRHDPVALPILERFTEVRILDSSTVVLPRSLAGIWGGCGGGPGGEGEAAVKLDVALDVRCGQIQLELRPARQPDNVAGLIELQVLSGSLRLADLGFYSLADFNELARKGAYYLSRLYTRTVLLDAAGQRRDVMEFLQSHGSEQVDVEVQLGAGPSCRIRCRLLAQRLPADVSQARRRKLREDARNKGQTPNVESLRRADWTILITNVPVALLSLDEAMVVLRVRWQIELLFKLWKSQGLVDEWRSDNPWRVLCEVYAKLVGLLMQHWVLLVTCWAYPDRSLFKAARLLRTYVPSLALVLNRPRAFIAVLRQVEARLKAGCRLNKRRASPSTYHRLLAIDADTTSGPALA